MASGPPIDFASGDHYAVLGVPRGASEAEIRRAYKAMALRYHPDKRPGGKDAAAELSFKRIAEAFTVLRDPEKRREYDVNGSNNSYVSYEEAERMWRSMGADRVDDEREGLPAAVPPDLEARRKATALAVALVVLVAAPRTMLQLLPGVAVVAAAAMLSRRRQASKWAWCALALLLVGCAAPWALRRPTAPPRGAAPPGLPHSGEEVSLGGGTFARVADPRHGGAAGPQAEEGWQQLLLASMASAVRNGQEQVLAVFSRQDCPWCDRQLPVLRRAILRRGGAPSAEAAGEATGGAAGEAGDGAMGGAADGAAGRAADGAAGESTDRAAGEAAGGDLAVAPLRVFILDAEEFPSLARDFQVEAFPTTVAWGSPGTTPMAAQGYLDDQGLDDLLRAAAAATPDPPADEAEEGGRQGLER